MHFTEKLRLIRKNKGLTQEALAETVSAGVNRYPLNLPDEKTGDGRLTGYLDRETVHIKAAAYRRGLSI